MSAQNLIKLINKGPFVSASLTLLKTRKAAGVISFCMVCGAMKLYKELKRTMTSWLCQQ